MGRISATPHKPVLRPLRETGRQRARTTNTGVQRERILAAATRLFATQGYASTTLEQIARELGDRKSTRLNSSHSKQSRMPSSA